MKKRILIYPLIIASAVVLTSMSVDGNVSPFGKHEIERTAGKHEIERHQIQLNGKHEIEQASEGFEDINEIY